MELSQEFDKVDILPIGEDVRHLDEPNKNVITMITAVYLRDSLINNTSRSRYTINCLRNDGELVRIMFDSRDWFFGRTPHGGVHQHPAKITRDDINSCTIGYAFYPLNMSDALAKMTIHDLLWDTCSWYVTQAKNLNKGIIPSYEFVDIFNRSNVIPLSCYDNLIRAHTTWLRSCNEQMTEPNTSDYDVKRLTLERTEYQSRINDLLTVKYAMLFAEQERK